MRYHLLINKKKWDKNQAYNIYGKNTSIKTMGRPSRISINKNVVEQEWFKHIINYDKVICWSPLITI